MKSKKKPWMKFYCADWRADPRLRTCSLSARGLWVDLMTWMHEGEPYGHLVVEGKVLDIDDVAQLVGRPQEEVVAAMEELTERKVCSFGRDGEIVSRRMVRDAEKADRDSSNGKGGGNPRLLSELTLGVNPSDNGEDKAHIPEARVDGGGRADVSERATAWRNSPGYRLAKKIADLCGAKAQMAFELSGWGGAPSRASLWLTHWAATEEDILASVRDQLARKRDGPPSSINFFEKGIARHMAKLRAQTTDPLPTVTLTKKQPETVQASHGRYDPKNDPRSLVGAIQRTREKLQREGGAASDGNSVQLLQAGSVHEP